MNGERVFEEIWVVLLALQFWHSKVCLGTNMGF